MKKIIVFSLVLFLGIIYQATAQDKAYGVITIPKVTLGDTISFTGNAVTKNSDRILTGTYIWSVGIYLQHISGASDSCKCSLQESVDGTNYLSVVGAPVAVFRAANAWYTWSGGTGVLPLYWANNYLRVSCIHYAVGTVRILGSLQLKNK